jgi:hypothetical protein
MVPLRIGQHQGVREPIHHIGRGRAATALFQPAIPSRADPGALRHLLASQAGRTTSAAAISKRPGIDTLTPIPQIGSEVLVGAIQLAIIPV